MIFLNVLCVDGFYVLFLEGINLLLLIYFGI